MQKILAASFLFTLGCSGNVVSAGFSADASALSPPTTDQVLTDEFLRRRHHDAGAADRAPADLGTGDGLGAAAADLGPAAGDLAGGPGPVADLGRGPGPVADLAIVDGQPADLGPRAADLSTRSDLAGSTPDLATPHNLHARCGWIGAGETIGEASFIANASAFQVIHPKWYTLAPDGVTPGAVGNTDLPTVVAAARANQVRIMPLIDADSVAPIRLMINDATLRATLVSNLVALAQARGYAGFDIDFEHLWTAADRPGFTAFMQALSTAFHAVSLEVSMAIGGMAQDDGNSGYSYAALAGMLDALHVMGYDFHYIGGDHLGPLAPSAWIDAVFAFAATTGHVDRFKLGVANYGIWASSYDTARAVAAACGAGYPTATDHMSTCPYGTFAAGRAPHCTTSQGDVWFEDVAAMDEKVGLAQAHGAGGVTYWTLGDEPDGFFAMVRKHYP